MCHEILVEGTKGALVQKQFNDQWKFIVIIFVHTVLKSRGV